MPALLNFEEQRSVFIRGGSKNSKSSYARCARMLLPGQ